MTACTIFSDHRWMGCQAHGDLKAQCHMIYSLVKPISDDFSLTEGYLPRPSFSTTLLRKKG